MAVLIPALVRLRSEFNEVAANRDKASDGWIGDLIHALSVSDHNPDESGRPEVRDADNIDEVHAIDVDKDLRLPGLTMAMVVAFLVARCRAGIEKRLRYIIFNGVIWSASRGWAAHTYTGSNNHAGHGHFSGSYDTAQEADTRPWGLGTLVLGTVTPPVQTLLAEDGELGPKTIRRWQEVMGTNPDGVISKPRSALVLAVQRHLNARGSGLKEDGAGIAQDGRWYFTVRALQWYLGTNPDGRMSQPVSTVVKALQRRLNTGRF